MTMRIEQCYWCPSCEQVFTKPRWFGADGERYHSPSCEKPMQGLDVAIEGDT